LANPERCSIHPWKWSLKFQVFRNR
jgi:hypothetical protein